MSSQSRFGQPHRRLIPGVCLLGLALIFASARAQVTLVADAHVNAARPMANSGSISNINVGGGYDGLLQFDLSLLPAGTTASQVSRAVLRVYVNRADTPGTVTVAPLTGAWAEQTVTYLTTPAAGPATTNFPVVQAEAFIAVDVTALVQGWIAGPGSNFGILLTSQNAVVQFDSKENDLTGHAATLEVALTASVGTGGGGSTGPSGPVGPPGPPGLQGLQGTVGPAGLPGAAGAQGQPGPAGTPGAAGGQGAVGGLGPAGPQGLKGANGAPGTAGPAGAVGATGPAGSQGVIGAPGAAGATGLSGAAGALGLPGTPGPAGATGQNGLPGVAGLQGVAGLPGAGGLAGAAGPQGAAGSAGTSGTNGINGAVGPAGQSGTNGANGSIGPAGPAGNPGQAGPAGLPGITYRGAWNAGQSYNAEDAVTFAGTTYLATFANSAVPPDGNASLWSIFAASGATGPTGPAGSTATLQIGTVLTGAPGSSVTVVNRGSAAAAVLDFSIPAGATGAAGTGGGTGTASGPMSMVHAVSYTANFYSINTPNANANEVAAILTWVPEGCQATRLTVFSLQAATVTVMLRAGVPGAMADTALTCQVSNGGTCTANGAVALAPSTFVDLQISHADSTPSGIWTALTCQ